MWARRIIFFLLLLSLVRVADADHFRSGLENYGYGRVGITAMVEKAFVTNSTDLDFENCTLQHDDGSGCRGQGYCWGQRRLECYFPGRNGWDWLTCWDEDEVEVVRERMHYAGVSGRAFSNAIVNTSMHCKIGDSTTYVEIQGGEITMESTPEIQIGYRAGSEDIYVSNNGTGDIIVQPEDFDFSFNISGVDYRLMHLHDYDITAQCANCSDDDSFCDYYGCPGTIQRYVEFDHNDTLEPGDTIQFTLEFIIPESAIGQSLKYNVSYLDGLIDPYFTSSSSTFNNGNYFNAGSGPTTLLNASGFVQQNITLSTGWYLSEVFEAQTRAVVDYSNISFRADGGERELNGSIDGSDLYLLYHMNNDASYGESGSLVKDFSGNGRDGVPSLGAVPTSSGNLWGGYSFDGDDSMVTPSDSNDVFGGKNLTVAVWINPNVCKKSSPCDIVARMNGVYNKNFQLGFNQNDDEIEFKTYTTCSSGSVDLITNYNFSLGTNTWYHVVAVLEHGVAKRIYVNGQLHTSTGTAAAILSGCGSIDTVVGRNIYNSNTGFNGTIDEVAIWQRALNATEISEMFLMGATKFNMTVRSCSDSTCSSEDWDETFLPGETQTTNEDLSVSNNRYFQYNATYFSAYDVSARLWNVDIGYEFVGDRCYQETANVTPGCGGYNNGTYYFTGSHCGGGSNWLDGNWSTFVGNGPFGCTYYINYSIPNGTVAAISQHKQGPTDSYVKCYNHTTGVFEDIWSYSGGGNIIRNSTVWVGCLEDNVTLQMQHTGTDWDFYEEGIWWITEAVLPSPNSSYCGIEPNITSLGSGVELYVNFTGNTSAVDTVWFGNSTNNYTSTSNNSVYWNYTYTTEVDGDIDWRCYWSLTNGTVYSRIGDNNPLHVDIPPCGIVSADLSPNCGGDACSVGESIYLNATLNGSRSCANATVFQIDGFSDDCSIEFTGGDISGLWDNVTITSPYTWVTGEWVISTIPDQCAGDNISAGYSSLWTQDPGTSTKVSQSPSPNATGWFIFEYQEPVDDYCGITPNVTALGNDVILYLNFTENISNIDAVWFSNETDNYTSTSNSSAVWNYTYTTEVVGDMDWTCWWSITNGTESSRISDDNPLLATTTTTTTVPTTTTTLLPYPTSDYCGIEPNVTGLSQNVELFLNFTGNTTQVDDVWFSNTTNNYTSISNTTTTWNYTYTAAVVGDMDWVCWWNLSNSTQYQRVSDDNPLLVTTTTTTLPPCGLSIANISTNCSVGGCYQGDLVYMNATLNGSALCANASLFQIDGYGDNCTLNYSGANMPGIWSAVAISAPYTWVTGFWNVTVVPNECVGKNITAGEAAIWQGDPLTGTQISQTPVSNATGTFYFGTTTTTTIPPYPVVVRCGINPNVTAQNQTVTFYTQFSSAANLSDVWFNILLANYSSDWDNGYFYNYTYNATVSGVHDMNCYWNLTNGTVYGRICDDNPLLVSGTTSTTTTTTTSSTTSSTTTTGPTTTTTTIPCLSDADCTIDKFCNTLLACQPRLPNGNNCNRQRMCISDYCLDNVVCADNGSSCWGSYGCPGNAYICVNGNCTWQDTLFGSDQFGGSLTTDFETLNGSEGNANFTLQSTAGAAVNFHSMNLSDRLNFSQACLLGDVWAYCNSTFDPRLVTNFNGTVNFSSPDWSIKPASSFYMTRNGFTCPSTICTGFTKVGDKIWYNVNTFSNYSVVNITSYDAVHQNLHCPDWTYLGSDDHPSYMSMYFELLNTKNQFINDVSCDVYVVGPNGTLVEDFRTRLRDGETLDNKSRWIPMSNSAGGYAIRIPITDYPYFSNTNYTLKAICLNQEVNCTFEVRGFQPVNLNDEVEYYQSAMQDIILGGIAILAMVVFGTAMWGRLKNGS